MDDDFASKPILPTEIANADSGRHIATAINKQSVMITVAQTLINSVISILCGLCDDFYFSFDMLDFELLLLLLVVLANCACASHLKGSQAIRFLVVEVEVEQLMKLFTLLAIKNPELANFMQ